MTAWPTCAARSTRTCASSNCAWAWRSPTAATCSGIGGAAPCAPRPRSVLRALCTGRTETETLSGAAINLRLTESGIDALVRGHAEGAQEVAIKVKRGMIRGRGANQAQYLHAIATHDINFGIGPAGTGKTYLAVAMAVEALNESRVQRLVLVRPAVEAGEKLGFLPGDLSQKVDPYLRPLTTRCTRCSASRR